MTARCLRFRGPAFRKGPFSLGEFAHPDTSLHSCGSNPTQQLDGGDGDGLNNFSLIHRPWGCGGGKKGARNPFWFSYNTVCIISCCLFPQTGWMSLVISEQSSQDMNYQK